MRDVVLTVLDDEGTGELLECVQVREHVSTFRLELGSEVDYVLWQWRGCGDLST
jgi:hypothetical protein